MKIVLIEMRYRGVALPKSELPRQSQRPGYLVVNDIHHNHLRRSAKTARVYVDPENTQLICTLLEPVMVWANEGRFMLSGFEHVPGDHGDTDYAQSWLCLIGWDSRLIDRWLGSDRGSKSRQRAPVERPSRIEEVNSWKESAGRKAD